jgi:CBS domain-containing protein
MTTTGAGRVDTPVDRAMTDQVVFLLDLIPMSEVRTLISQHDYNGFPVVNTEGRLVGMITKGDLLRVIAAGLDDPGVWQQPVSRWMAKGLLALRPHDTVGRAIEGMIETGLRSLPVIDDRGHVVGILSRNDVIAAVDGRSRRRAPPGRAAPGPSRIERWP